MADITITPGDITAVSGALGVVAEAGEAIDAGQAVYIKSSDGKAYVASDAAEASARVAGIALSSAEAAGQPVSYYAAGEINVQAAAFASAGILLVLSTAGAVQPVADKQTGEYVTVVGWSTGTAKMMVDVTVTGQTSP